MAVLIASILFCYTNLPDSIAVTHDGSGKPVGFLEKQYFFYLAAGVSVFFNLLMGTLKLQLTKVNFVKLNPESTWAKNKPALDNLITGWFDAFVALVNTFLVFVLFGLNSINAGKGQMLDFNYNWMIILGGAILMILVFFLPLRILFSNPSMSADN
jgi:hypothetical protein